VLTIGTALHVDGHRIVPFPWALPARWTAFNNVLPERFAMYVSLAAAVAVALWTASARGRFLRGPYLLPALAVAALVPAVWQLDWRQHPERWAFFTQGLYKSCIPRDETLAIFPYGRWGDSMLWQAETGFRFRMAEGNMGRDNLPERFYVDPTVAELAFKYIDPEIRPSMTQLLGLAQSHHVDRFVSVELYAYPNGTQLHSFGPVQLVGGVLVSPACGWTSLTGDTRLVPGGRDELHGRPVLTLVADSRHALADARASLDRPDGGRAAERLLARSYPDLKLLQAFDGTATPLVTAVDLVGRARSTLAAGNEASRRRAGESLGAAERALTAYQARIDAGVS